MASTAAAWGQAILRPLPPPLQPSLTRRHLPFWISTRTTAATTTTVVRLSPRPAAGGRGEQEDEEKEEGSMSSIDTSRLLSVGPPILLFSSFLKLLSFVPLDSFRAIWGIHHSCFDCNVGDRFYVTKTRVSQSIHDRGYGWSITWRFSSLVFICLIYCSK
ncbi:unnamed protein product [Musa textilis]